MINIFASLMRKIAYFPIKMRKLFGSPNHSLVYYLPAFIFKWNISEQINDIWSNIDNWIFNQTLPIYYDPIDRDWVSIASVSDWSNQDEPVNLYVQSIMKDFRII